MKTKLSVNINKIATLRNARGGNVPNVLQCALDIESFGAHGITVHPRPDGRHIRYEDVFNLKKNIETELNVEGYPSPDFMEMVLSVSPHQVTLVPDAPDAITSNSGWNVIRFQKDLTQWVSTLKSAGIRTSIFIDPISDQIKVAQSTGVDRIELYTEAYAVGFPSDPEMAVLPYINAANIAAELGLGINAGHDLSLQNLNFFSKHIPKLDEVSIGHALICDALYLGLENTVKMYLHQLNA
jgi:pyridoxine 5-phosphate synthase